MVFLYKTFTRCEFTLPSSMLTPSNSTSGKCLLSFMMVDNILLLYSNLFMKTTSDTLPSVNKMISGFVWSSFTDRECWEVNMLGMIGIAHNFHNPEPKLLALDWFKTTQSQSPIPCSRTEIHVDQIWPWWIYAIFSVFSNPYSKIRFYLIDLTIRWRLSIFGVNENSGD